ncbi:hypothetical protein NQ314_018621 [Rhamnusium bicolor]|uniref:ATP-dependent DNA helicase n=1 Tax=Rhamnusium bicolor TaxID=1586634 RepID=A0AAV8WQG9_9CUCU|nr:hypothetical protein NQ314_018621 [Rhamnusium bicolor]
MEDLSNDELKKEFGTEWEQELLNNIEKVENDYFSGIADEDEKDLPRREHLELLSKCFGHKKFRPMQWKIINSIMNGRRDNCAIMTTGYGKSLCYQYPSAYMGGLTIIVANISACLLGSANTKQKDTIDEIFEDKYSLVYLTPEFSTGDYGKDLLKKMYAELPITLVAIDEAHCVSSWGHDFRVQYRQLGIFKDIMPNTPILAVTATATPKVRDDIIELLKLKNPQILCTGFDRPNLYFSVHLKSTDPLTDFRRVMEREGGEWKFSGSTIIYCITRKNTETISLLLSEIGIKSLPYHAGLSLKVRKDTHEQFVKDKVDVIVATIAFGMGIDKPDVRNIIHYGAPSSIEGYYQEVGRAGRDGLPSKCTTFYSYNDFAVHRRLRENSYGNAATKANKEKMADLMLNYLTSRDCRRQFILSHFEDIKVQAPKRPLCCDNCVRKNVQPDNEVFVGLDNEGRYDFTQDAQIFLEAVNALDGKFGIAINAWLGSGVVNIQQQARLGSEKFNNQQQQPTTSTFVKPEKNENQEKESSINLYKPEKNENQEKESSIKLYKLLMNKRYEIATSLDCMPYLIASNRSLMNMAIQKPVTLTKLRNCQLEGFTEAKIAKFGEEFLQIIRSNLNIDTDVVQTKLSIEEALIKYPLTNIGGSARVTYTYFKSGLTVEEIAQKRGVISNTIISHLADCLKAGCPVKLIELGITDEIKETIINAVKSVDTGLSLLTPIKNACPPDITYSQVKVVVNYLQVRQHLKKHNIVYEDFDDVHGVEDISDPSSIDTKNISRPNSPGKLTQLLNAIDEINKTSGDIKSEKDEDSNFSKDFTDTNITMAVDVKEEDPDFSEDFADADLAAACDVLETSLHENDDEEPQPKKIKTEDDTVNYVLDSPPRDFNSTIDISESENDHHQIDTYWTKLKQGIMATAEEVLGKDRGTPRNHWFDEECAEVTEKKMKRIEKCRLEEQD